MTIARKRGARRVGNFPAGLRPCRRGFVRDHDHQPAFFFPRPRKNRTKRLIRSSLASGRHVGYFQSVAPIRRVANGEKRRSETTRVARSDARQNSHRPSAFIRSARNTPRPDSFQPRDFIYQIVRRSCGDPTVPREWSNQRAERVGVRVSHRNRRNFIRRSLIRGTIIGAAVKHRCPPISIISRASSPMYSRPPIGNIQNELSCRKELLRVVYSERGILF